MKKIECVEGLPTEYEKYLIEKYESFVISCRYIELYYPTYSFFYFKVYELNELHELLIFGVDKNTAKCLNLFVDIDQNILDECIKNIFKTYKSITKIKFDASYKEYSLKKLVLYSQNKNHIINLPSTTNEYYSKLGHSTRKSVKKQRSKLFRDYPTANIVFKMRSEIDEELIEKIIELNFNRTRQKGINYGNDHNASNINKYSQHYGFVTYIELDGEIIAGTISYIIHQKLVGIIVGHDNKYSKYSLGIMCQLIEIEKTIELGLSTYDFLWGDNDYKKRLLAEPFPLYSYLIYKKYSFIYLLSKIKGLITINLYRLRLSKHSKPLRDAIKSVRKKQYKDSYK